MRSSKIFAIIITAVLAGCSGSQSAHLLPGGQLGPQTAQMKIVIPAAPKTSSARRSPLFVATNTAGIDVKVYAQSDTKFATPLGETQVDISSGSTACGGQVGSPRTCTIAIPAPIGADAFVVRTYDADAIAGSFAAAKQLASAIVNQTIVSGTANSVNITLGGVVASVAVSLQNPSIEGVVATSQVVSVTANDVDGNAIVSNGYVDANGAPVTVTLAQSESTGPSGGTFTLGTQSLSAPSSGPILLLYDGLATTKNCTTSPCSGAFSNTITATPSNGATVGSATVTLTGPTVIEYAIPTSASSPNSIVSGPDNRLWFVESSRDKIGAISTSGAITEYAVSTGADPESITAGPDGNMWFTEFLGNNIGKMTTYGGFTEFPLVVPNSKPLGITAGADGNLWFTEETSSKIGHISPATGQITTQDSGTSGAALFSIVSGSDQKLWFGYCGSIGSGLSTISTSGAVGAHTVLSSSPFNMTATYNNIWATEDNGKVAQFNIALNSLVEYPVGTAGLNLQGITPGVLGSVWVTQNAANLITSVSATGATMSYGIPGSGPSAITTDASQNVWFTEVTSNRIGELIR